jgi:hypothetical protein
MNKMTPEQVATQIIDFYNEYDLRIAGKINNQTAYQLIETIEKRYQTDSIRLVDGTRIWNLLRIFLYSNFQKFGNSSPQKTIRSTSMKSILSLFKESFLPLHLPHNIPVWGFSSSESRKLYNETYYDIYLDPLYEVLGDNLAVFEWPETSGYRRIYDHPVFSRHHVPMHIPLWSKTFWNVLFNKLTGHAHYTLESESVLLDIIDYVSTTASVDKTKLKKDIDDFITVFVSIKYFLHRLLKKNKPQAVLIRCGYGRFPMALSQACRELQIRSIEVQHGLITIFLPAYRRATPTENKDCVPEYFLAHGDMYADMVKKGNLFDTEKVFSTGYPYLEKKQLEKKENHELKQTFSRYPRNLLFTSQWIIAEDTRQFVTKVADLLEKQQLDIGLLFKPHPYDKTDYSEMKNHTRITLVDKYEDTFKLFAIADLHSTVYSTSGLEAMEFAVPNIFVDLYGIVKIKDNPFIVTSPEAFVSSMQTILSDYETLSRETKEIADLFFTKNPEKHFAKFFIEVCRITNVP